MRCLLPVLVALSLHGAEPEPRPGIAEMVSAAVEEEVPLEVAVVFTTTTRDEAGNVVAYNCEIRRVDLVWLCRTHGPVTPAMGAEYRAKGYISVDTNLVRYAL